MYNNNNNQREYYLTDVINILLDDNDKVCIEKIKNSREIIGINTAKSARQNTDNIGYATPINLLKILKEEILLVGKKKSV